MQPYETLSQINIRACPPIFLFLATSSAQDSHFPPNGFTMDVLNELDIWPLFGFETDLSDSTLGVSQSTWDVPWTSMVFNLFCRLVLVLSIDQ